MPGALSTVPRGAVSPASRTAELETAFDWAAYLDYNTDVAATYSSELLASHHYTWRGVEEHRLAQRIPLVLRYSACGGLMNQHYSHLGAFMLARLLGADVAMPVSLTRGSFQDYYSMNETTNEVHWSALPQSAVYDVALIDDALRETNSTLYVVPLGTVLPDLSKQKTAYPAWLPDGFDERQAVHLQGPAPFYKSMFLRPQHVDKVLEAIREQVVQATSRLMLSENLQHPPTMLADLPCNLFSVTLNSLGAELVVEDVARSLLFAEPLQRLADKVREGMGAAYNGLHLRLEKDAKDWATLTGGMKALEYLYWRACKHNGFSQTTPLYLASGILSYNDTETMQKVLANLAPYAKTVYYKELFLTPAELSALSADQKSAVDYLVLLRSKRFVGLNTSTYSWWVREYRKLLGYDERSSYFVSTPRVGTDRLFSYAAALPSRSQQFVSTEQT